MSYEQCKLFNIQSSRELNKVLQIDSSKYISSDFLRNAYHIKLLGNRLYEMPCCQIKILQKKILKFLNSIQTPDYYKSSKKHNYMESAITHSKTSRYIFNCDIKKFYPHISRDKCYKFWNTDMCCSGYVSKILTNLTTVTLSDISDDMATFINDNGIGVAHLPTGSPTSSLLSFLVNKSMYSDIENFCRSRNYRLSVYVDDICISAERPIKRNDKDAIEKIINSYGFWVNKRKTKINNNKTTKRVNGLMISTSGRVSLPNSIQHEYYKLKHNQNRTTKEEHAFLAYRNLYRQVHITEKKCNAKIDV